MALGALSGTNTSRPFAVIPALLSVGPVLPGFPVRPEPDTVHSHDNIHQPPRHIDHLPRLFAAQMPLHGLTGQGGLLGFLLIDPRRHLNAVSQLSLCPDPPPDLFLSPHL